MVMAWTVNISSALAYLEPASLAFAVSFPARSAHSDALSFSVHARFLFFRAFLQNMCHVGGRVCVNVRHKGILFVY